MLLDLLLGFLPALPAFPAYAVAALLLLAAGVGGVGFGQDVLLLALAAFTLQGTFQPVPLMLVAWAGILAGDALGLWVGRDFGARWLRRPWAARIVAPENLPVAEGAMRRWGALLSFVTRWLPGQRGLLFFVGGSLRLPWRAFLLGDALAAAIQVPLFVYGVRALGWDWRQWREPLERADDILTVLVLLLLAVGWLLARKRRP